MAAEKEAHKQKQVMGSWETQPWVLSNPDEKLSAMDPPPIIGGCSNNNNGPLIADQNKNVVDGGVNAGGDDKTTAPRTSRGGRKKSTGKAGGHDMHIWTERERRKKMRDMFASLHALLPQLPPKACKTTIVDEAARYIKSLEKTLESLEKKKQERLKQAQQSAASTTILYDPSVNINPQWRPSDSREAFMADQGSSINNSSTDNNLAAATNVMTMGTSTSLSLPNTVSNPVGFQTWTSSNVAVNVCGAVAQFNVCSLKKPGLFTSICAVLEKYKIEVLSAHVSSDKYRCFYMIQAQVNGGSNQFEEAFAAEEAFRNAAEEMTLWLS